jgi:tRNA (cytidine32/uridine32-2'-O)-methyltransferase
VAVDSLHMDLGSVDVVLVRPSRPANVAAACRALKNMGLRSLWLVGVEPGFVAGEARNLAYGAWDVLDAARPAASLREATAAAALVVGTSGRAGPDLLTPRALAGQAATRAAGGRMALVFGPEASGLLNDELALCHAHVHIPADPAHPSLNLAQAVLVVAYELRLALAPPAPPPPVERATAGELEAMLDELREGLLGIGYLGRENPDAVLAELRRLAARAAPTAREVTLLRGLARQLRWAGARIAATNPEADNPAPAPRKRPQEEA